MTDFRLAYGAAALFGGAALLLAARPAALSSLAGNPFRTLSAIVGGVLFVWGGSTMVRWASV